MRRSAAAAASVVVVLAAVPAAIAQRGYDPAAAVSNFDTAPSNERPSNEPKVQLPKFPTAENLIAFDAGPARQFDFFIDGASLAVDKDAVVRFTVVAKSSTATNVSYEGIRCGTGQRKTYAYGRPDGTWREPKDPPWVNIGGAALGGYHFTLYQDYFCPARNSIKSAAEGLYALKHGGHPRALDSSAPVPVPR